MERWDEWGGGEVGVEITLGQVRINCGWWQARDCETIPCRVLIFTQTGAQHISHGKSLGSKPWSEGRMNLAQPIPG